MRSPIDLARVVTGRGERRRQLLTLRFIEMRAIVIWALMSTTVAAVERPNFLIIVSDDQAVGSLDAYGDRHIDTPRLDQLAASGVVFDQARHMGSWTGAVCTASRTMIMTGRSVWRIPGSPATAEPVPPRLADQSLPAVFGRAGYRTMRTCKVGNSYTPANNRFQTRNEATKRGGEQGGSEWHTDRVIDFLDDRAAANDSEPWLVYLGFSHPHDPRRGPEHLLTKYDAVSPGSPPTPGERTPPLPPNYLPAAPFPIGHPDLRDEVAVEGVGARRDEATVRNELGKQAACIEAIDRQIGRVLDRLEELGELEDTYIVFTSDHGIAVGSHGLMGKQNLYEHSWRVPLIVSGPGVMAGSRSGVLIYLMDLLPTLCELAEVSIPETVEAQSFAAAVTGKHHNGSSRTVQYGVYSGGTKPGIRAVTDGRWKLIEYDVLDGSVRETQLFDLQANPDELLSKNLATLPEYRTTLSRMRQRLAEESLRWGDPYPISD